MSESESTDLDPGYLVTHDDPHHANVELAARQAKQAALIGKVVRLGIAPTGLGHAVIVRAYSPDCVNAVLLDTLTPVLSTTSFEPLAASPVCVVYYRHSSGVQYVALVVAINAALQLDLLVLSDGYVDLGSGPGVPVHVAAVTHGAGRLSWQTEIDA